MATLSNSHSAAPPFFRPPAWLYPLVFLIAWACYVSTLNPALFQNDSPETITACVTLGVPHPPGYPLFTLLGRLFSLLQLGNPAMTMNFFAAFLGALGACLFAVNVWFFLRPLAGKGDVSGMIVSCLVGSLGFAFSKSYWSSALAAKGGIYGFQVVLELGLLACWQSWAQSPKTPEGSTPNWGLYLLPFLFSLGLANHWPSLLLMVPAIILAALLSGRDGPFHSLSTAGFRKGLTCLVVAIVVLSLYLYLPLRSQRRPSLDFGTPSTFGSFFASIFRTDYFKRETLASFLPTALSTASEKSFYVSNRFASEFNAAFSLLALVGIGWFWFRGFKKELLFLLAVLLTTIAANLLYLEVAPIEYWHLDEHLMGANWVTAFLASAGIFQLTSAFQRPPALRRVLIVSLALLPVFIHRENAGADNQAHEFLYRGYGIEALKSMQRNATYFAESDYDYFSILYLQQVERRRPDVDLRLTPFLSRADWGRVVRRVASGSSPAGNPLYCAFPNGPFVKGYLRYASRAFFKPAGTITEFMPPSSLGAESLRPLEELWSRYLVPDRRSANPINGFLFELCAHPFLDTADYLEMRGDLSRWDLLYDRALSLISENPWRAATWARRAGGDLRQGKTGEAIGDYLRSADNYLRIGQKAPARQVLKKALLLDPSNSGLQRLSALLGQ